MNRLFPQKTSWRIDWNMPEGLQFCSYIGQMHDWDPNDSGDAMQLLEREWNNWWKQLLSDIASTATFLSGTPLTSITILDALGYEPPLFHELNNLPQIQSICREHWPSFNQIWNGVEGQHRQINGQLSQVVRTLDLNELVQKCVQLIGRSGSAAFSLQIGVIRWPEDYRLAVSKDCLVIGAGYLELGQRQALISLLQSQICDLISDKQSWG